MSPELFKVYPTRNVELRAFVLSLYEYGKTICQEPSASLTSGLDEHAIRRQASYIAAAKSRLAAIAANPIPDLPATHPLELTADLSVPYKGFVTSLSGTPAELNEQTGLMSDYWMLAAVEAVRSNSSSMAGSVTVFDFARIDRILDVMAKLLDDISKNEPLDLPETADPASAMAVAPGVKKP